MIWLAEQYWVVFGFLMGGAIASFACVVVERAVTGESINGRSHCACGRQLKVYENVPIAGWLLSRGRARCCGAKLPASYLYAELAGAFGWAVCGLAGVPGLVAAASVTTAVVLAYRNRALRRAE
jgi:leader peptidase (prepilin peptidase)/N-methyltransferase